MRPRHAILNPLKNQKGMALLLAVAVTVVLVAVSVELHRRACVAAAATAINRNRVTLNQMAIAGIHGAIAMLIRDKKTTQPDSLQEDWANEEKITALLAQLAFDQGALTVKISDELARIQINALVTYPGGRQFQAAQKQLWERLLYGLLHQHELSHELSIDLQPSELIDAIKDWLDSGDDDAISGLNGAESDYYQSLDPPYPCANSPMQHVSELALVKGIGPELFNGAGETPGLKDLVTVFGLGTDLAKGYSYAGRININTASPAVLNALLPVGYAEAAAALIDYRQASDPGGYLHDLSQSAWYQNVPGLKAAKIDPAAITTKSDIFRIQATARLDHLAQQTMAIVSRVKDSKTGRWQYKVLRWIVKYNTEG